jgi:hypothetical protein
VGDFIKEFDFSRLKLKFSEKDKVYLKKLIYEDVFRCDEYEGFCHNVKLSDGSHLQFIRIWNERINGNRFKVVLAHELIHAVDNIFRNHHLKNTFGEPKAKLHSDLMTWALKVIK